MSDVVTQNLDINMLREHLGDIPDHALPEGYAFRWYQPGDADLWVAVQAAADKYNPITPALFIAQFGEDEAVLAERQFLLMNPEGEPVGAISAWYGAEEYSAAWGRIHWVAIVPEYQGKGLAKPMLSRACQHPDNPWALHGLHECLMRRGEKDETAIIKQRLELSGARADIPITASCFCRLDRAA